MKKLAIYFSRIHANHKIRYIIIGIIIIIISMLFLEKALKYVGIIASSIVTSYIYNLFADTKREIEKELKRIETEEMIR